MNLLEIKRQLIFTKNYNEPFLWTTLFIRNAESPDKMLEFNAGL